jgi:hypothetical protein
VFGHAESCRLMVRTLREGTRSAGSTFFDPNQRTKLEFATHNVCVNWWGHQRLKKTKNPTDLTSRANSGNAQLQLLFFIHFSCHGVAYLQQPNVASDSNGSISTMFMVCFFRSTFRFSTMVPLDRLQQLLHLSPHLQNRGEIDTITAPAVSSSASS